MLFDPFSVSKQRFLEKNIPPPKINMDVSENSGTPKSSILVGFSIINHPFWGTPMFGNTHMEPQNIGGFLNVSPFPFGVSFWVPTVNFWGVYQLEVWFLGVTSYYQKNTPNKNRIINGTATLHPKFFGVSPQLVIYIFHPKNRVSGVILLGAPQEISTALDFKDWQLWG